MQSDKKLTGTVEKDLQGLASCSDGNGSTIWVTEERGE